MNNVYLFPLSNSLTMSKLTLPYHIFEDRYKEMIQDAIDNGDYVSVLFPQDCYQDEICCLGKIEVLKVYPDKKMDILLTGIKKVKLTNKISNEKPYLTYEFEEIKEELAPNEDEIHDIKIIKNLILKRFRKSFELMGNFENLREHLCDPEVAINYATFFLLDSMDKKKEILTLNTITEKLELLMNTLLPECGCLTTLMAKTSKD